jgi:hypothetical protein
VHDTGLDSSLRISQIQVELDDRRCIGLKGGSYRVEGTQIRVNVDRATLR